MAGPESGAGWGMVPGVAVPLVAVALALGAARWLIRRGFRAPRRVERVSPADFGLPFEEATIPTANGKRLFAWFIPPPEPVSAPVPGVVLLHGWGANAGMLLPLAVPLHRAGYALLLLDARNHGRSDGDDFSSMPRFAEDLDHGLDWLRERPEVDRTRLAVLGHSVGAGAALLAASRRDDVAAVVSLSAFAHPADMMRRLLAAYRVPYRPLGWAVLRYVERAIGHRYDAIAPRHTIGRVRCPVLLAHGADDGTVPVADAHVIHGARAGDTVELCILDGFGHTSAPSFDRLGAEVCRFLDRTLLSGV